MPTQQRQEALFGLAECLQQLAERLVLSRFGSVAHSGLPYHRLPLVCSRQMLYFVFSSTKVAEQPPIIRSCNCKQIGPASGQPHVHSQGECFVHSCLCMHTCVLQSSTTELLSTELLFNRNAFTGGSRTQVLCLMLCSRSSLSLPHAGLQLSCFRSLWKRTSR